MLWGNVLAFILAGIQSIFQVIHLDPVTYYMDTVPINFSIGLRDIVEYRSDCGDGADVDCPDNVDF